MNAEIAMLHDVSKCTACRACMVACKQWKDLPAEITPFDGQFQSHKDLSPSTYNIMRMIESHNEKNEFDWLFLKWQCMHCGNPGCVKACPTGALSKKDNGAVNFDRDICIGCGYCEIGCPFDVPKVDKVAKKSSKCNLCYERLENNMVPACAKTCTSYSILFGTRDEMTKIAEDRVKVLKNDYPNAQLYGVSKDDGVKGTSMMYILTEKPSAYGLPDDPKLDRSLVLWKDYIRPGGKALVAVSALAVAGAALVTNIKTPKEEE